MKFHVSMKHKIYYTKCRRKYNYKDRFDKDGNPLFNKKTGAPLRNLIDIDIIPEGEEKMKEFLSIYNLEAFKANLEQDDDKRHCYQIRVEKI